MSDFPILPQALADAVMPRQIDINPWAGAPVVVTGTAWSRAQLSTALGAGYALQTGVGAQNDAWSWDVPLAAGTWRLDVIGIKNTAQAIITADIDGTALASLGGSASTMDFYAGSVAANSAFSITGIVLPTSGKKRLTFTAATRNASNSTGWLFTLQWISLTRTA